MNSMIKDIALAPTGHQKIAWVKEHMPLLNILNERYAEKKIFDGLNMVVTIHLEAKTAYLAQTLKTAAQTLLLPAATRFPRRMTLPQLWLTAELPFLLPMPARRKNTIYI